MPLMTKPQTLGQGKGSFWCPCPITFVSPRLFGKGVTLLCVVWVWKGCCWVTWELKGWWKACWKSPPVYPLSSEYSAAIRRQKTLQVDHGNVWAVTTKYPYSKSNLLLLLLTSLFCQILSYVRFSVEFLSFSRQEFASEMTLKLLTSPIKDFQGLSKQNKDRRSPIRKIVSYVRAELNECCHFFNQAEQFRRKSTSLLIFWINQTFL